MNAYNEILQKYGYPPEVLDIEFPVQIRGDEQPRFADIVVFDDKARKRPFIVVEAKEPKKSEGERQGQRYATILRAVYVLWTNGSDRSASVLVNRYPEEAVGIADIPPSAASRNMRLRSSNHSKTTTKSAVHSASATI